MKHLLLLLTFGMTLFADASNLVLEPKRPEKIQVMVEKDASEALLEVKGPYYIYNPHDGSRISSGLLGKRFLVHGTPNGIKWGEEFIGVHQIHITPRSADTSILINGIQYEGTVLIYSTGDNIQVINALDIEQYVKSLLVNYFPYPVEQEVMAAMAIVTRTDAYYNVLRNPDAYWHVKAQDSGYMGSALITPDSYIDKVTDSTKNLILVHSQKGKNIPFPAKWTEHSGGKTATYSSIFRVKEAFFPDQSIEAPHAALDREESKWRFSISQKGLEEAFNFTQCEKIELFTDSETNKVYAVRLKNDHAHKDLTFFQFQQGLGRGRLQSNDFVINSKDDLFSFTGYGKGHGVGLCLYSASAMAQNGENALRILSKFYPETFLYNLSALPALEE